MTLNVTEASKRDIADLAGFTENDIAMLNAGFAPGEVEFIQIEDDEDEESDLDHPDRMN